MITFQIDEWMDYIPTFVQGSEFEMECSYMESYLSTNTFLVGHSLSIADVALWSALAGAPQKWETSMKSGKFENLVRWYNCMSSEYGLSFNEVLEKCLGKRCFGRPLAGESTDLSRCSDSSNLNTKVYEKTKAFRCPVVDLPNAEVGKVCLRFAPEPSGYLHIGHSKAALLN
uniref:Glutamate--tRNA ligase n=1 Tax=Opuntia streptacantha TaxID=393608 RepID=A0A7C8YL89_OPUST